MNARSAADIVLLVVDDDAVDRAMVRRAMRGAEQTVTIREAKDAPEALEVLRKERIDCAILDYRLPRADGLSVLQQLRGESIKTPIIVLTGQGDEQLAVEIMKAGAMDYLPKNGLAPERLRQAVAQAVRVRRAEIAAEAERGRVERLQGFMAALAATRTVPEVAHAIMTQGLHAFHAMRGTIALRTSDGSELEVVRADGYPEQAVAGWQRIPLATATPVTDCFARGEPLYFESAAEIVARYPDLAELSDVLDASLVALPLQAGQTVLGVVSLSYRELQHFEDDHRRDLAAFARVCGQALERAQLFELANRERRRAEEASRAKDEFLAVVSHELRTPLNAILGWATMLRGGSLSAERATRAAEVIERNAQSQAQLIDDLLDVSRIITGKMRVNLARVAAAGVVEAALDVIRPTAEAKGVRLESSVGKPADDDWVLLGDAERLQQVFWNLLSNAIKFTPRGGTVKSELFFEEGACVFRVQDSGQGIAREFLPHAFERFQQEDTGTTRKSGGLGLGLAIVRHIVDLHGGKAEVESEGLGRGATFTIRLPLGNVHAATPGQAPVGARVVESVALPSGFRCPDALRGMRVIVVDDEEDARDLVVSILTSCSCVVRAARSVAEALSLFRTEPPDVLVSDLGMPYEDGYTLIERIRQLPAEQGRSAVAIALTAYARGEDRAKALLAGFDAHIAKPIEPGRLVELLATLSGGRSALTGSR